ncbi:glutathione S-transferase [Methylibium sp.]|uniref:glutathione S-transferase n=1 Tax=Methylibium sp. TaxID=2067992 RepID=UPI003D0B87AD
MQLIGMLDSPYVRRVAVSLQLLGLPFEHRSISVFRGYDAFRRISPVVKAPSLVCDDGAVLLDSTLILDHAEALAAPTTARRLMPAGLAERRHTLQLVGLALAACEKSVQIVYEQQLRPADKQHAPWLARVTGQTLAAYGELEAALARRPLAVAADTIDQAGVSTAVAWYFTQALLPGVVSPAQHPRLAEHSARAECLPAFRAAPHGDGTCPVEG